ncbi:hypothetical protein HOY80DRAFT_998670 [Tuber brumale]|nr:hypothetical protein HOY80DRAFT_998670 [Tuber brumale]
MLVCWLAIVGLVWFPLLVLASIAPTSRNFGDKGILVEHNTFWTSQQINLALSVGPNTDTPRESPQTGTKVAIAPSSHVEDSGVPTVLEYSYRPPVMKSEDQNYPIDK